MKMPKIETAHVEKTAKQEFKALREQNEKSLEKLEGTEALWIDNLKKLDAVIPHDDVLVDDRTYSFNVLRNAWLSNMMTLEDIRKDLEKTREQLDHVNPEQAN